MAYIKKALRITKWGELDREELGKLRRLRVRWYSMLARCENPADPSYQDYGGRGIIVCEEWHNLLKFVLDMGEPPSEQHTLERVDNMLGYSKENCRWALPHEQCINQRVRKNNKSGIRGVCWDAGKKRWDARGMYKGVYTCLYKGPDFDAAVAARKAWEKSRG